MRALPALLLLSSLLPAPPSALLRADDWLALRGRLPGREQPETLLIQDGRVVGSVPGEAPDGYQRVGADTLRIYPLWIDALGPLQVEFSEDGRFADYGEDKRENAPAASEPANRRGLYPERVAWQALTREGKEPAEAWQDALRRGFGLSCVAPGGGILAGQAVVVALPPPTLREAVVAGPPAIWGDLQWHARDYPSTHIGAQAQLRQFMADLQWWAQLPQPRSFDPALQAGQGLLEGTRLWLRANSAGQIDRALSVAAELDIEIGIQGGSAAYLFADRLARQDVPVILRLDWGEAPELPAEVPAWSRPLESWQEQLDSWQAERGSAAALAAAGVPFAIGSRGAKREQVLPRLRSLLESGLSEQQLLRALSGTPARLFGLDFLPVELGAPGSLAAFTVLDRPLAEEGAELRLVMFGKHWHDFGEDR